MLFQDITQDAAPVAAAAVDSLAARLTIPSHLLTHSPHPTLHVAYERYKGCLEAQDRLTTLVEMGEWSGRVPILEEVLKLFVPKSTWYNYYVKAFGKIEDYPALHDYLERTDDAPLAKDLFRTHKSSYTYTDIFDYRARCERGRHQEKRKDDNSGEGSSKQAKKAKVEARAKKVEPKRKSGGSHHRRS
jgi:hypothetical protein